MSKLIASFVLFCACVSTVNFVQAAPGFLAIPRTPIDVSDDGRVVVGGESKTGFRWTEATGIQELPMRGESTNADGSVIAGGKYRWTAATGAVDMGGIFDGDWGASATGMSGDGAVVVGTYDLGHSFRWTAQPSGPAKAVPGMYDAVDVSLDGKFVLGNNAEAVMWSASTGAVPLGKLPNETQSYPSALSHDAKAATGMAFLTNGVTAFRWTSHGGMVALPGLTAGFDISGDGSMIVGSQVVSANVLRAVLWTDHLGSLDLQTWLTANGMSIPAGWKLTQANAVSGNGNVIVGVGTKSDGSSTGWVVKLPPRGDANNNGLVDGSDYVAWADHFLQSTNLYAHGDFNWDGVVNAADYIVWADHFSPFTATSVAAVPEPTSVSLLVVGMAAIFGHRLICRRVPATHRYGAMPTLAVGMTRHSRIEDMPT